MMLAFHLDDDLRGLTYWLRMKPGRDLGTAFAHPAKQNGLVSVPVCQIPSVFPRVA